MSNIKKKRHSPNAALHFESLNNRSITVPRVKEPLPGGRRLGRNAKGDLLGDVTLAVSVKLGAAPGGRSEMEGFIYGWVT